MKKDLRNIPVSVLDLANIIQGDTTPKNAFDRSIVFAQAAERFGYRRYWFAEHHNMESVASAATAVVIGHVAQQTSTIRIGSGGIMLPNHAPLVIAEQFGTLEALYPGRIDLGLGRAPGTDQATAYALRRNLQADVDQFPSDVAELIRYLGPADKQGKVRAVPGVGTGIPVWILGSSTFGAQLAAAMGLPFGFAAHFAPTQLSAALEVYYTKFKPSVFLDKPYALTCVNVIAADTTEEAMYLSTSLYQLALGMIRGQRRPMAPPVHNLDSLWSFEEQAAVKQMFHYTFVGDHNKLSEELSAFVNRTGIDEVMVASNVFDVDAKVRSLEIIASLFKTEAVVTMA